MSAKATLDEMKDAILNDTSWWSQKGPHDTAGWERDEEIRRLIRRARIWEELRACCPHEWQEKVCSKTLDEIEVSDEGW